MQGNDVKLDPTWVDDIKLEEIEGVPLAIKYDYGNDKLQYTLKYPEDRKKLQGKRVTQDVLKMLVSKQAQVFQLLDYFNSKEVIDLIGQIKDKSIRELLMSYLTGNYKQKQALETPAIQVVNLPKKVKTMAQLKAVLKEKKQKQKQSEMKKKKETIDGKIKDIQEDYKENKYRKALLYFASLIAVNTFSFALWVVNVNVKLATDNPRISSSVVAITYTLYYAGIIDNPIQLFLSITKSLFKAVRIPEYIFQMTYNTYYKFFKLEDKYKECITTSRCDSLTPYDMDQLYPYQKEKVLQILQMNAIQAVVRQNVNAVLGNTLNGLIGNNVNKNYEILVTTILSNILADTNMAKAMLEKCQVNGCIVRIVQPKSLNSHVLEVSYRHSQGKKAVEMFDMYISRNNEQIKQLSHQGLTVYTGCKVTTTPMQKLTNKEMITFKKWSTEKLLQYMSLNEMQDITTRVMQTISSSIEIERFDLDPTVAKEVLKELKELSTVRNTIRQRRFVSEIVGLSGGLTMAVYGATVCSPGGPLLSIGCGVVGSTLGLGAAYLPEVYYEINDRSTRALS